MKRGIGLVILIVILCFCADALPRRGRATERARPYEQGIDTLEIVTDSEEYEVLSAFLKARLKPNQFWSPPSCVEIFRSCGGFGAGTVKSSRKMVMIADSVISYDAAQNYGEKNARKWRWDARFNIGCEYRWYDYGHPEDKECESGYCFSRVGVDSAKTEAVFQLYTYYKGCPTGASWIYMEKRDRIWYVLRDHQYLYIN